MLISWKEIAWEIYNEIKKEILEKKLKVKLAVVLVWNNSASLRYVAQKEKWAKYCWIDYELIHLSEDISQEDLEKVLIKLNVDNSVSWYIVQLPLPKHIDETKIINLIAPNKDVDWFHPENQWKLLIWDNSWFVPCTPAWILEILERQKIEFYWKQAVVVGRSNIVGKPATTLLINKWCTVTSCNSKTPNIANYTKHADIVIAAVWKPWLINEKMVKNDSIVIDVWFTVIDWKIYWDCETEKIDKLWAKITPVPGGVWAMTVAMLMKNTLKAFNNNK
jgi:methylenetetrahydrofolate dehydrogenase (NADP+)/methenyltetrahydrofolate cyclohydrolase